MQKIKIGNTAKICFSLLSLSLLTSAVLGYDNLNVSYDSASYMPPVVSETGAILNMNSADARAIEATFKLDSNTPITTSNTKVNLSLRDSDIRQVLRMLADKAKINIVFDESVEGKITLDLSNVTVNEAFMIIFKSSQLTYTMDHNTLNVMSIDASKDLAYTRQNMTVLPVKYVSAESVADFLNNNLFKSSIFGLSAKPVVTANPRTNQIIVFGTNSDVSAIKRVLPVLDTKPLINNFKINHTTPKEMAMLLCDSLFYQSGVDENIKSEDNSDNSDDQKIVLGGGVVACRDTSDEFTSNSGSEDLKPFKGNPLTVTYFPELGRIATYGGSVEQVEIVKEFIKEHDKKQLMAYIELSVIELNERGSKEFSNEWNLWTPFISLGFTPDGGLQTSSVSPFFIWGDKYPVEATSTSTTGGTTTTVTEQQYVTKSNNKALTYKLKYLVENGNGRVLINPKIMVTNGKESTIDMTSDYIKSVTSQVLQSSSSITSAVQRTYDIGSDEGLMIKIVPFISPDGYVSMNISPEFATIKQQVYTANELGGQDLAATLLQRRDLDLKNIRIKDGETLVLAGLIQENETQTVKKMPILSDLPFVGVFFRGNSNDKTRSELVIVVTPHIVKDNSNAPEVSTYNL